jgi:hypothetical protein
VLVFLVILRFKIVAFDVWLEVSENQKVFLTLWRLRSGLGADELDCTSGSFPLSAIKDLLKLYQGSIRALLMLY